MKNKLILRLLDALVYANPAAYREELIRFAALNDTKLAEVLSTCDNGKCFLSQRQVYKFGANLFILPVSFAS